MDHQSELQDLISRVEAAGGLPVDVVADPNLTVLATVSAGNFTRGRHILRYRPNVPYASYHQAHQLAVLLRKLTLPAARRANLAITDIAVQQVSRDTKKLRALAGADASVVANFAQQVTSGLLRQLVSIPIGMRADEWLRAEYPSLAEDQVGSTEIQQRENLNVLSERVRAVTPVKVFDASVAMNAANAIFATRLGLPEEVTVPYEAVGALTTGHHLITAYDQIPTGSTSDQQLIDRWGHALKISAWYEWRSTQETEVH